MKKGRQYQGRPYDSAYTAVVKEVRSAMKKRKKGFLEFDLEQGFTKTPFANGIRTCVAMKNLKKEFCDHNISVSATSLISAIVSWRLK